MGHNGTDARCGSQYSSISSSSSYQPAHVYVMVCGRQRVAGKQVHMRICAGLQTCMHASSRGLQASSSDDVFSTPRQASLSQSRGHGNACTGSQAGNPELSGSQVESRVASQSLYLLFHHVFCLCAVLCCAVSHATCNKQARLLTAPLAMLRVTCTTAGSRTLHS